MYVGYLRNDYVSTGCGIIAPERRKVKKELKKTNIKKERSV